MIMNNKKGMLASVLCVIIILFTLGYLAYYYISVYPDNVRLCNEKYRQYSMETCAYNLEPIQLCEMLNATYVKTEGHLFSSSKTICYKNGDLLRI